MLLSFFPLIFSFFLFPFSNGLFYAFWGSERCTKVVDGDSDIGGANGNGYYTIHSISPTKHGIDESRY